MFLSTSEKEAALVIPKALDEAERLISNGTHHPYVIENCMRHVISRQPLAAPEMIAVRDAATLRKVDTITSPVVVSLFVRIGATRLLDNRVVHART